MHGPGIQLIGAHTIARPEKESSPGAFTVRDDMKSLIKLCELKRINFASMVDAVFSPKDCTDVYTKLINQKDFPVVSQFDWSEIK